MYIVYGKSLQKEKTKKRKSCKYEISGETAMQEFMKNTGAYPVSPEYSSEKRCLEFIELAKSCETLRCLYIARLDGARNKKGETIIDEKTGKPKMKYFRFKGIPIG